MGVITSGTLPQGQLQVGVSMVLVDRFTNPAQRAKKELKTLYGQAQRAVQANLSVANQMASAALGVVNQVENRLKTVLFEEGVEFSDMMTRVQIITEATEEQFKSLRDTAASLGLRTVFTSKDVASGMKYLAMAGNSAEQIQSLIKSATYLAAATGSELGGKGGAADLVTNIAKAFHLKGEEAVISVADQMAKGTLSANISIQDLAESIKYSASEAVNLKFNLAQVTAAIGVLGNAGLQGSMAGVSLSNMMRQLSISVTKTGSSGAKALREIGLSVRDIVDHKGDLLDLSTILRKIDAVAPESSVQRQRIFRDIFGVRGQRAAMAMLANLEDYDSLLVKINQSQGYAKSVADEYIESYAGRVNMARSALENLRISFVQAAEPILKPVLGLIANIAEGLKVIIDTPFGKFIAAITIIGLTLAKITLALVVMRTSWKLMTSDTLISFRNILTTLSGGWVQVQKYTSEHINQLRILAAEYAKLAGLSVPGLGRALRSPIPGMVIDSRGRYRDSKGKFLSKKAVDDAYEKMGHRGVLENSQRGTTVIAGGDNRSRAMGSLGKAMAKFSKINWVRGTTKIAKAVLKGAGTFLAGPWGLAITTLSMAIPAIIGARKRNSESLDKNTESNNRLKSSIDESNKKPELTNAQQITAMYNAIRYWSAQMEKIKPTATINLSLTTKDGKYVEHQLVAKDGEDVNLDFAK